MTSHGIFSIVPWDRDNESFAYQATIVGSRGITRLVTGWWYDHQFKTEALMRRDFNWSVPDQCLYSEAFTSRARSIPRGSYWLEDSM